MPKIRFPVAVSDAKGLPLPVEGEMKEILSVEFEQEIDIFEESRHLIDLDAIGGEVYQGLEIDEEGLEEGSQHAIIGGLGTFLGNWNHI